MARSCEVYNLSDLDWADIKVLCEIVMAFKLAQETLEGELYITGSRVVATLEKIRADLILTRLEWADSEKGTRVLTSVIEGFETRFGDGSNVCEVDCEGHPFLASLVLSCLSHFLQRLHTLISYCH